MDFLTALRSGRPIRRRSMISTGPLRDEEADTYEKLCTVAWIWLLAAPDCGWISLIDGRRIALGVGDYLAPDWEVMP